MVFPPAIRTCFEGASRGGRGVTAAAEQERREEEEKEEEEEEEEEWVPGASPPHLCSPPTWTQASPHRTVTLFTCHLVAGPDQDGAHVSVEKKCENQG